MPRIYDDKGFDEVYVVVTSTKREYELNREQAKRLDEEMKSGNRGRVIYKDFDIFISHVADFYFKEGSRRRDPKYQLEAPKEEEFVPLTEEQLEKIRVQREALMKKLNIRRDK